jgi:hypothetical protein
VHGLGILSIYSLVQVGGMGMGQICSLSISLVQGKRLSAWVGLIEW